MFDFICNFKICQFFKPRRLVGLYEKLGLYTKTKKKKVYQKKSKIHKILLRISLIILPQASYG